jgi:Fe-S-cluster containining protein
VYYTQNKEVYMFNARRTYMLATLFEMLDIAIDREQARATELIQSREALDFLWLDLTGRHGNYRKIIRPGSEVTLKGEGSDKVVVTHILGYSDTKIIIDNRRIVTPSQINFVHLNQDKEERMPEGNETPQFCKDCGRCCNSYPGGWLPDEMSIERQKVLMDSHLAVWDSYYREGEGEIHYLRPATVADHQSKKSVSYSWGGRCIFLGKSGCKLSFEERPWECKDLVATAPEECSGETDLGGLRTKDFISRKWEEVGRGPDV